MCTVILDYLAKGTVWPENNGRFVQLKKLGFLTVNLYENWQLSTYTIYNYRYNVKKKPAADGNPDL